MLRLYGAPLSNYYNTVKTAMMEKAISFESAMQPPSQEAPYLEKSPMGKIPCVETEDGFLTETHAILDWLEESYPAPHLLPVDPFARAKVRELVQAIELYVELVGRRGLGALFGRDVPEDVKEGIRKELPKGLAAVRRLARFDPWIAGEQFTYADLFGYWAFSLASPSAEKNAGIDVFAEIPGLKDWYDRVGARESVKKALGDRAAALKAMKR